MINFMVIVRTLLLISLKNVNKLKALFNSLSNSRTPYMISQLIKHLNFKQMILSSDSQLFSRNFKIINEFYEFRLSFNPN